MLEEGKSDPQCEMALLIAKPNCMRLQRFLSAQSCKNGGDVPGRLLLGLCGAYTQHPQYDKCINYLIQ